MYTIALSVLFFGTVLGSTALPPFYLCARLLYHRVESHRVRVAALLQHHLHDLLRYEMLSGSQKKPTRSDDMKPSTRLSPRLATSTRTGSVEYL